MKFWMSGEIQADISDDFRRACNQLETATNKTLEGRDYGNGLLKWNFIAIILSEDGPQGYNEVKRYKKRDKSCEFRLKIAHTEFKNDDASAQMRLLCEALLRSLSLLESMNVPDLDLSALRSDFVDMARRQEWLV